MEMSGGSGSRLFWDKSRRRALRLKKYVSSNREKSQLKKSKKLQLTFSQLPRRHGTIAPQPSVTFLAFLYRSAPYRPVPSYHQQAAKSTPDVVHSLLPSCGSRYCLHLLPLQI